MGHLIFVSSSDGKKELKDTSSQSSQQRELSVLAAGRSFGSWEVLQSFRRSVQGWLQFRLGPQAAAATSAGVAGDVCKPPGLFHPLNHSPCSKD